MDMFTRAPPGCWFSFERSYWTGERTAELHRLNDLGLSASQIAKELRGTTRSAVIGKLSRMGWKSKNSPSLFLGRTSPPRAERNGGAVIASIKAKRRRIDRDVHAMDEHEQHQKGSSTIVRIIADRRRKTRDAESRKQETRDTFVQGPLVPLLELKGCMCRFPVGNPETDGFGFCGVTAAADENGKQTPYCRHHMQIAYKVGRDQPRISVEERWLRVRRGKQIFNAHLAKRVMQPERGA